MNKLALAYENCGRLSDAVSLFEEQIKRGQRLVGFEHTHALATGSFLAQAYYRAGRANESMPLFQAHTTFTHGGGFPYKSGGFYGGGWGGRGYTFVKTDTLTAVLPQLQEIFARRRHTLGPDDPETLFAMDNLAVTYEAAGRLNDAIPLFEAALQLRKAKLGADHPETLRSMSYLAVVYLKVGRRREALTLLEATFKLKKVKLGPDNPDTLVVMDNLATAYAHEGRLLEALPLYEAAIKLKTARLGPNDPDTLLSTSNLVNAYDQAKRHDDTVSLEWILNRIKAKVGKDHPDTLAAMDNLAAAYAEGGQLQAAISVYAAALNLKKTKFGADHIDTLESRNALASSLSHAGRYQEAADLHAENWRLRIAKPVAAFKSALGHEGPCLMEANVGPPTAARRCASGVRASRPPTVSHLEPDRSGR
jgi:tetratricopeptide (TPR) repeat protein